MFSGSYTVTGCPIYHVYSVVLGTSSIKHILPIERNGKTEFVFPDYRECQHCQLSPHRGTSRYQISHQKHATQKNVTRYSGRHCQLVTRIQIRPDQSQSRQASESSLKNCLFSTLYVVLMINGDLSIPH